MGCPPVVMSERAAELATMLGIFLDASTRYANRHMRKFWQRKAAETAGLFWLEMGRRLPSSKAP